MNNSIVKCASDLLSKQPMVSFMYIAALKNEHRSVHMSDEKPLVTGVCVDIPTIIAEAKKEKEAAAAKEDNGTESSRN